MGNNRFSAARGPSSAPSSGDGSQQPLSGESAEGGARSCRVTESKDALPDPFFGLGPLAEMAITAQTRQDISALLRACAHIAAGALSLGRVVVVAPGSRNGKTPHYAGLGWSLKQQQRIVRRFQKKASDAGVDGQAGPSVSQSRQAAAYTSFESTLFKKQGVEHCLVTIGGSGSWRVAILADRQGVTDAQAVRVSAFLKPLAAIVGLALEHAGEHQEVAKIGDQVRRAKIQWQDAVDVLPQLVCVLDRSGRVIRVNRTLEAWGLGSVKSASGKTIHALLHPRCRDADCALRMACRTAWEEVEERGLTRLEVGDPVLGRELVVGLVPNQKDGGEPEPEIFGFVVIEDVTERRITERMMEHFNLELKRRVEQKTEELNKVNVELRCIIDEHCRDRRALEESQQKYTSFVENTLTGIYLVEDGRISFCNSRFAALLGYSREELSGQPVAELLLPVESAIRTELAETGWADGGSGEAAAEELCRAMTKKGQQVWLKTSRAQILTQGEPLIVGNVIDVTQQIEAETVLIRSERELRDLSEQLINAQEEERQRIAGELHDGIGQQLSVIKFGVERVLEEVSGRIPPDQEDELGAVVARVRQTIEEVRRVSMDLRPSILDDLGLVSTIDWFCREFQQMDPKLAIHKNLKIREGDIPVGLKVAIFRILQEACNNVHKYAKASLVSVKLVKYEGKISFSVSDDGIGFDYERMARLGQGFGLGSMKQRARLSGGTFRLSSAKGVGTRIEVEWPLDRHQRPTSPFSIA